MHMSKIIFGQKDKPHRCVDCYFYKAGSREYRTAVCEAEYKEIRRVTVTKVTPAWCPLTLVGVWIPVKKSSETGNAIKRWTDEVSAQ